MGVWYVVYIYLVVFVRLHIAPPIHRKEKLKQDGSYDTDGLLQNEAQDHEYYRYLTQVVYELEKDVGFREKLGNASEDELRSGKIADQIDLVAYNVREKLDEVKRMEIEYQRDLLRRKKDHMIGIDRNYWNPIHHENKETFEKDDLMQLLSKHNDMMLERDKKRHEDFKKYELEKGHKRRQALKAMTEEEKQEEERKRESARHKKHDKIHEPGHKAQVEEVWEKKDGLDPDAFDPRTFFNLHDKNSDGYLDRFELETFFLPDLDKVYNESDPDTDPRERTEETERMREHVMKSMDDDKDGVISLGEFIKETQSEEFEKDGEWKPIVEEDQYTEEELDEYERIMEEDMETVGAGHPVDVHGDGEMPIMKMERSPEEQASRNIPLPEQEIHEETNPTKQEIHEENQMVDPVEHVTQEEVEGVELPHHEAPIKSQTIDHQQERHVESHAGHSSDVEKQTADISEQERYVESDTVDPPREEPDVETKISDPPKQEPYEEAQTVDPPKEEQQSVIQIGDHSKEKAQMKAQTIDPHKLHIIDNIADSLKEEPPVEILAVDPPKKETHGLPAYIDSPQHETTEDSVTLDQSKQETQGNNQNIDSPKQEIQDQNENTSSLKEEREEKTENIGSTTQEEQENRENVGSTTKGEQQKTEHVYSTTQGEQEKTENVYSTTQGEQEKTENVGSTKQETKESTQSKDLPSHMVGENVPNEEIFYNEELTKHTIGSSSNDNQVRLNPNENISADDHK